MNPEYIKKRALRILTTPPELLYAVSRHWFAIALCLGIGVSVTVAKVATDSPFYGAKARLLIKEQGATVEQGPNGREGDSRRFLRSQVEILKSTSVLRALVRELGADQLILQDEGVAKPSEGRIVSKLRTMRRRLRDAIDSLNFFDPQDVGEERSIQKAVSSLRRRSAIHVDSRTGMIDFHLYGHRRENLERELETWIDSYFHRMNEMAKESYDSFYTARTEYWKELEEEDLARLMQFQTKHPEVSEDQVQALTEELVRLRVFHSQLNLRLGLADLGTEISSRATPDSDPKLTALRARKLALELELSEARAIYSEKSANIRMLKDRISAVDRGILGVAHGDSEIPADPKERLSRQIAQVSEQLKEKSAAHVLLKMRLQKLQDLDQKYKTSKNYREKYSLAHKRSPDFTDSDRSVRVTIVDPPSAGTQPVHASPVGHVFLGSMGGLLCGVLMALLLEIFTGKIRFKSDVESDLELPVVGVIQKR